jgi:leucyl aminopeptidase
VARAGALQAEIHGRSGDADGRHPGGARPRSTAGLFSNNDELSERLTAAGLATGEKVWRMPLGPEYDKMVDSKFADIKNTGGRHGGSITAAQFLQRFVNDVPWAHLDIAGTA